MNLGADVVAAGAVLWRLSPGGVTQLAVVHRPRYDDWSLPKGKLRRGESLTAAAVREVSEETGHTLTLGARLGHSRYRVELGEKVVYFWAARAGTGAFTPNAEVDELRWLAPSVTAELLTYRSDLAVLDRFRQLDPPAAPLLLVRHAKASRRAQWIGDDDVRPLTDSGHRQALGLVVFLSRFGPLRAYAAPPLRCVETIQPLAARLGLSIRREPVLSEFSYQQDPNAGLALLLELAAEPGAVVVCGQGAVIADLIGKLTGRLDPPARSADTWVLGLRGGIVLTADYYSPSGPEVVT